MAKNNKLILSLIVAGIFILALSLIIATQTEKQKPGSRPLARIDLNLGKVFVLKRNLSQKEILTRRMNLFALDSVETGPDGDASLEFDTAFKIRIPENSLVTLDEEGDRIVVIIKRGDLEVEDVGREGSLFISREGQRWAAGEYELYKRTAPEGSFPDLAPVEPSKTGTGKYEGLTSELIQDTLKTHRNSFFKCYTQLLQRTPGVVGQASLGFTIDRTGKVSQADLISSSLSDSEFKRCLIDAIRRVEFKAFQGDAISTVFPLKFE